MHIASDTFVSLIDRIHRDDCNAWDLICVLNLLAMYNYCVSLSSNRIIICYVMSYESTSIRTIKMYICHLGVDRRLKIPHSAKVECGFRTTPEECLYDSGPIGPSV